MAKKSKDSRIRICGNCERADTPLNRGLIATEFKCTLEMQWVEYDKVCDKHRFVGEVEEPEIAIPASIISMSEPDVKEAEDSPA